MNDYMHNKEPKDSKLCKIIRRSINLDRKRQGLEWDDIANELGLNGGTLDNKLKPSYANGDMTLNEFTHFLELSADYAALEYIANKFDLVLIPKKQVEARSSDINALVDMASIENNDVFKVVKKAIEDGVITPEERESILKEIDEAQTANAELKDTVAHLTVKEE